LGITAAEAERELILKTLEKTGHNKAEAARQMGLDVKTIRNKLKTYKIDDCGLMIWLSLLAATAAIAHLRLRLSRLNFQTRRIAGWTVESDKTKQGFTSHGSKVLKAPPGSMQETTHLLLERTPGALTEKQKRLNELNLQGGRRVAQMIGNLPVLCCLEAGIFES